MEETAKKVRAPKKNWTKGLQAEFKKIIWPDKQTLAKQTVAVVVISVILSVLIAVIDAGILQALNFLIK